MRIEILGICLVLFIIAIYHNNPFDYVLDKMPVVLFFIFSIKSVEIILQFARKYKSKLTKVVQKNRARAKK